MQLDKRILEGKKPLGVFELEKAKELISLEDFQESRCLRKFLTLKHKH